MECARQNTNPYIPLSPEEEIRAEPTKNHWIIKGCAFLVLFLLGLCLFNTAEKKSGGTVAKDYGKYHERRYLLPLKTRIDPKTVDPNYEQYRRYFEQNKHHEQYRPSNDLKSSRSRGTSHNFFGFLAAELGILAVKNPKLFYVIMAIIMVVVGFIGSVNFAMDLLGHVGLLSARINELYGVKLDMPLVDETATQHGKYYSFSCDEKPCRRICAEVANKYGKYCVRHIVLRVIVESILPVDRVISSLSEKYGKPKFEEQTRRFLYTDSISGRTIIVLSPQDSSPDPSNKNSESQLQSPEPSPTCAEMRRDSIVKIIATGRLWDKEII